MTKNKKEEATTKKVVLSEEKKEELRKFNIKDILSNSKKNVESLIHTNLGTKKESIYKSEIFETLSDKEKKAYRKKIRNYVHSLFSAIVTETNETNLKTLISSFDDFYKQTYKINDYSFGSIASENTKGENKEIIIAALNKIKATKK